jgi:glyceraldehyde 3-phosphate dehydrogenase (phosphorylating)
MTIRVGINGMGRIGREYLRYTFASNDIEIVAVNDIADLARLVPLLRRDSTFGRFNKDVEAQGNMLIVDGRKIAVTTLREPRQIPWAEHGAEIVIESTGKFRTRDQAGAHLAAGAQRVLISAPGKGVDATIVMGVNDEIYDPSAHDVISNASCTTNCVAPMVKVLHESFGIVQGFMTTVHAITNDQNVLDAPHKDPRRARTAATNIIPTSTGAARAVGQVLPELAGRLDGVALRVPVVDGSLVDLGVLVETDATVDDVNGAFASSAASGPLAGKLRYTTEPLVSTDVIGDEASCIFDAGLTQASARFVKVFGWYDNEWGYTCRLADLTRLVAGS